MTQYLDMDFALQQLGGDQALLEKMFKRFVQQYTQAMTNTQQLMAEHRWQDARLLVHSVKGVAGNLGMTPLYQAATHLELRLKQETEDAEAFLGPFLHALQETLKQLSTLQPVSPSDQPERATQRDLQAVDNLFSCLKRNEFISPTQLDTWLNAMALAPEDQSKLHDLISDLEYHQAIELLAQIQDPS
ncbi:Hpt domain-containing protein [Bowmanella pacifica]|uniref:HPt domain-containing protein n=1 Tax=Bowmanella pacifica TaxID=502051 RepID=A0A918DM77_9ALTE|nr:Hpt domain-containing protein [Bowmanella pacifica]GGO73663.1 hypothetical protein GCM10010982_34710 [Bowmanella pacifica]